MQVPVNDPALLIPAMAYVTEHLGFAFTSSVLQTPPFTFARQLSTLDHLTRGRVAWNIVTSYLPNAAASLGYGGLPPHEARYDRADEYLDVTGVTAQQIAARQQARLSPRPRRRGQPSLRARAPMNARHDRQRAPSHTHTHTHTGTRTLACHPRKDAVPC